MEYRVKEIIHHNQVGRTAGSQGWYTIKKSIYITYHVHIYLRRAIVCLSSQCRKGLWRIQYLGLILKITLTVTKSDTI